MIKTIHLPFDARLLPLKTLNTSAFSCMYEYGKLRYIKIGTVEVVRMIYAAVRDENWNTIPYQVEDEKIEEREDGFIIRYVSIFQSNGIYYKAAIHIEAKDYRITFSIKGEALSSFKRNRIGICALHPINDSVCKEANINRPDGTEYTSMFPEYVNPVQPFKDIMQMQWPVNESYDARLEFYGDIFETEDQRNWSDNSYKTYSTPVELPLPVQVKIGDVVEQKMVLSLIPKRNAAATEPSLLPTSAKLPFPKIGYNRVGKKHLDNELIRLLQDLPFDHYRVELLLSATGWKDELADALRGSKKLETKLELIIYFSNQYETELENFVRILRDIKDDIKSVLVLQVNHAFTPTRMLRIVYPALKGISSAIKVGYGTDGNFSELNRNLPGDTDYDFVSFSLTPQAHLNDTRTILENLDSQRTILKTLRYQIGDDKEVHVFITFKSRIRHQTPGDAFPADNDDRLHGSFGAAWTLLTIQNLSTVQLSFYDTIGYKGIVPNRPSELYNVLNEIRVFKPVSIIPSSLSNSAEVVLENAERHRLVFILDRQYFQYNTETI
ncbi:MAG: hypothetical protein ABIN89_11010 [Chitinophagaceae bacterium]